MCPTTLMIAAQMLPTVMAATRNSASRPTPSTIAYGTRRIRHNAFSNTNEERRRPNGGASMPLIAPVRTNVIWLRSSPSHARQYIAHA